MELERAMILFTVSVLLLALDTFGQGKKLVNLGLTLSNFSPIAQLKQGSVISCCYSGHHF